jgi:hypothetical protein
VVQLVAPGSVATQSVVVPEAKVTVPVAAPGSPVSARRAVFPESMVSEDVDPSAVMVNDVGVVPLTWGLSAPVALAWLALAAVVVDCPWPPAPAAGAPWVAEPEPVDESVELETALDPDFPEDDGPEDDGPEDNGAAGDATAGVPELPFAPDEAAPEWETARKMATPAATPTAAPNAARRAPPLARRVKRPPSVVALPTCPTPVPLNGSGIPLVNRYKTYRSPYSNCGMPRDGHAQ